MIYEDARDVYHTRDPEGAGGLRKENHGNKGPRVCFRASSDDFGLKSLQIEILIRIMLIKSSPRNLTMISREESSSFK